MQPSVEVAKAMGKRKTLPTLKEAFQVNKKVARAICNALRTSWSPEGLAWAMVERPPWPIDEWEDYEEQQRFRRNLDGHRRAQRFDGWRAHRRGG